MKDRSAAILNKLRRCLWLYIALVFLEGPLRKWVVPQAASALLVARDPIVLAATFYGFRLGLFRRNRFLESVSWLGFVSVLVSLFVGAGWAVTLYGWRTDFFHIPIAILVAKVFDRRDFEQASAWLLGIALPMGILMAIQFRSPPGSWINAGMDEKFKQIGGLSGNHIRPPGTFSFITGPAAYFPLVLALVLVPVALPSSRWTALRMAALMGLALGTVFSASRTLWAGEAIVIGVYVLASVVFQRKEFARKAPAFFLILLGMPAFLAVPSVAEAMSIFLQSRVGGEEQQMEFLGRALGAVTKPIELGYGMPLFGNGLGVGTIVGSMLSPTMDMNAYGDSETELLRHFIESGLFLGGAYALLRCYAIVALLGKGAVAAAKGSLTPLLIWGVAAPMLFGAQIGQSTTLGMLIVIMSLVLLAAKCGPPQAEG